MGVSVKLSLSVVTEVRDCGVSMGSSCDSLVVFACPAGVVVDFLGALSSHISDQLLALALRVDNGSRVVLHPQFFFFLMF